MPLNTALTELLSIEHPVLLAPMDIISDATLTVAVSAAGGLGILGGGYGEARWLDRQLDIIGQSGHRFGVGFITWSLAKKPELLDQALTRKPAIVMLSFGNPQPFVKCIKDAGALAICQVHSVATALDAIAAGADLLVAQGTEGGGHGVSRGLITLLPEIIDASRGKIPVVAAGGIADGRGLAASLMLGACGVLIGTRFYASEEAAGAQAAKERICKAGGDDTARSIVFDISRRNVWPAPFAGRCIRNSHAQRWIGREVELMQHVDEVAASYLNARESGDFDMAAVIAGEAAGLIARIEPAGDIVKRIVAEAQTLLARGANSMVADIHGRRPRLI